MPPKQANKNISPKPKSPPPKPKSLPKTKTPKSPSIKAKTPKSPPKTKTPKSPSIKVKTPKPPSTSKTSKPAQYRKPASRKIASPKGDSKYKSWLRDNFNLRDFVIFGTSYCKWCNDARNLAKEKNVSYVYYDIESLPTGYFSYVRNVSKNFKTIPMIFYKGKFIGGYSAMIKIVK